MYATALSSYGIAGLLSILLIFTLPLFLLLRDQSCLRSPLRMAALKALLLYTILMFVDGAINFIPVMAFYWFVYMVFLHGWPGGLEMSQVSSTPRKAQAASAVFSPGAHHVLARNVLLDRKGDAG